MVHIWKKKLYTESKEIIDPILCLSIKPTHEFLHDSLLRRSDNFIIDVFYSIDFDSVDMDSILFTIC